MKRKKAETKKEPKKVILEISRASVVFWSVCLFLLLGWTFVLGILVGRGFLPKNVMTLSEIQGQIAKLKEIVVQKRPADMDTVGRDAPDPKFAFYDSLSTKREEVARKGRPSQEKTQGVDKQAPGSPSSETNAFTIQVAALDSEEKAVAIANRLKERGHKAYVSKTVVNDKTRYRIRCGLFKDPQEAKAYGRALSEETGMAGYVTKVEP